MIRFPNRFHASVTPSASNPEVEPNVLEPAPREAINIKRKYAGRVHETRARFDFRALTEAWK